MISWRERHRWPRFLSYRQWTRGHRVFEEGQNQQTLGSDVDALEDYVSCLPQPFGNTSGLRTEDHEAGIAFIGQLSGAFFGARSLLFYGPRYPDTFNKEFRGS